MQAIPGYEGLYSITLDGRIFSHRNSRYLKTRQHPRGYLHIALCVNGGYKNHLIHRLMAETYLDRVNGKTYVNHKNFDKTDNRPENLEWCTQQENVRHASRNGYYGKNGGRPPILTQDQADKLRARYESEKITQTELAEEYSVSPALVNLIIHRKKYAA